MAATMPLPGDSVLVHKLPATVRFVGKTAFAEGVWVGVELADAVGRNDGSVRGVRYFSCAPQVQITLARAHSARTRLMDGSLTCGPALVSQHGLFVQPAHIKPAAQALSQAEQQADSAQLPTQHLAAWKAMENTLEAEALQAGLEGERVIRHLARLHDEREQQPRSPSPVRHCRRPHRLRCPCLVPRAVQLPPTISPN